MIRLAFPQLTEERRKDLTKQVRKYGEEGKVALRNIRRDAMEDFKKKKKASELTEDDLKQLEKELQDLTDKRCKDIDELTAKPNGRAAGDLGLQRLCREFTLLVRMLNMPFFKAKEQAPAPAVDFDHLPRHIAIIMDGNGRWAQKRGLPRTAGHAAGAENFRTIATYCKDIGLEYL